MHQEKSAGLAASHRLHIVVNYLGHRGSGMEYSLEMTKGLLEAGFRVSAIICSDVENLGEWSSLPLERLVTVKTGDHFKGALMPTLRFMLNGARRIAGSFKMEDVDLFYVPMTNPLSVELERRFRKRGVTTLFTLHDVVPHPDKRPLWLRPNSLAARYMARRASRLALLTERFREQAASMFGRDPGDIVITPHGVFRNLDSRGVAGPPPISKVNFLFIGRIVRYKGLDLLADAYARLESLAGVDNVSLRVVGSGDMEPYASALARCGNVRIDNRFVPPEEIPRQLRMPGTVVVLPYTSSSQSGVIPQAMHEGVPVITTRLPGLLEQTLDGRLAVTCASDADSIFEAMRLAVDNPQLLREKAEAAQSHIDSLHWDRIAAVMVRQCIRR